MNGGSGVCLLGCDVLKSVCVLCEQFRVFLDTFLASGVRFDAVRARRGEAQSDIFSLVLAAQGQHGFKIRRHRLRGTQACRTYYFRKTTRS